WTAARTKPARPLWSAPPSRRLDQDGDRPALGYENGLGDVAKILAVRLQGQRCVAAHFDAVEVVPADRVSRRPAGGEREQQRRQRARRQRARREEVEPLLEHSLRRRLD